MTKIRGSSFAHQLMYSFFACAMVTGMAMPREARATCSLDTKLSALNDKLPKTKAEEEKQKVGGGSKEPAKPPGEAKAPGEPKPPGGAKPTPAEAGTPPKKKMTEPEVKKARVELKEKYGDRVKVDELPPDQVQSLSEYEQLVRENAAKLGKANAEKMRELAAKVIRECKE